MGDGHQHVGLEVGLVLPHPPDDRGIGEPQPGLLLHPFEDSLEGEVAGARLEALLVEDVPTRFQQGGAQLFPPLVRLGDFTHIGGPGDPGVGRPPCCLHVPIMRPPLTGGEFRT